MRYFLDSLEIVIFQIFGLLISIPILISLFLLFIFMSFMIVVFANDKLEDFRDLILYINEEGIEILHILKLGLVRDYLKE